MTKRKNEDPSMPRRRVLAGLGAAISTAAIGCGDANSANVEVSPGTGGAGGSGNEPGNGGAGGAGGAGEHVDLCQDTTNLSPEELLAPIDTFVILCMENRSFDHYLGSLSLLEKRNLNGLSGSEKNPAPNGTFIDAFKLDDYTPADPPHDWDSAHNSYNGGKNDGFVLAHDGDHQADVMGYHVREQIPILYALADAHAVCDHRFASVMGPTWPNRFFLHGATSKGRKTNAPVVGFKSIFELLDEAGVSHRNYFHDVAWSTGAYLKTSGLSPIEQFFTDAENGTLPNVCLIDPHFFGQGANDDHPDHDVRLGQALIASVYAALGKSPQWNRCMFILTYDEHGGFFDHVPPPTTVDDRDEFRQLGFRVPSIVAGPFTKSGCTVTTQFEHVSILSTLARRFGLPMLNARMAAANDLSSCIQPANFDSPRPAVSLPIVPVPFKQIEERSPAPNTHPELRAMLDKGLVPAFLDRRSEGLAITKRVLEAGERLMAVQILP